MRTRWKWLIGVVAALVLIAVAVAFFVDEPLRRITEKQMNAHLKGYTARIGRLDFHPLNFAVDFYDVLFIQNAHPNPPVLRIHRLNASVQWGALIHGRVVADFLFDTPQIYVDRQHLVSEANDPTPVSEHGWQEALQAMYPLKINQFRIRKGSITYVDAGQARPLTLTAVEAVAGNIRNVKSDPDDFPSPLTVTAAVFETGTLSLNGSADFLRVPYAGVKGKAELAGIPLDYAKEVAARYGVALTAGTFSGKGYLEVTPNVTIADLEEIRVDGLKADYTYRPKTADPGKEAAKNTAETAKKANDATASVSNASDMVLRARRVSVNGASVGLVNVSAHPTYRLALTHTNLLIENFSNQKSDGLGVVRMTGRFMDSGEMQVKAAFRPENNGPDFDLDIRIEDTDMRTMNDLLRAHAKFDVVSGVFSVYSEMRVKNGRINGYVKPLFRDLVAYDSGQDQDKPFGEKVKEKVVNVVGKVLKNRRREEVVTVVPISGPLANPKTGTLETVMKLVENAFIKAILPGFETESARSLRQR
jgi:hypothetical protein